MSSDIELNYYLTLTFKSSRIRNLMPMQAIRETLMYVFKKLNRHCESDFKFVIEFCLSNAIHYHIIYRPINKGHQIQMMGYFNRLGNCKNEIIRDYNNVLTYLKKDLSAIKQLVSAYFKDDINDKRNFPSNIYLFDQYSKKIIKSITKIRKIPALKKKIKLSVCETTDDPSSISALLLSSESDNGDD